MLSDKELKAIKIRKYRCHEKLINSKFELYDDLAETLIVDDMPKLFKEIERLKQENHKLQCFNAMLQIANYQAISGSDIFCKAVRETLGGDTLESPKE